MQKTFVKVSLLTIFLASCNGYDLTTMSGDTVTTGTGEDVLYTDQYTVDLGNRKMDILFVIDNSGSMGNNQSVLANSFSQFISSFADQQIDYHIGIVTTDNRPASDSVWTSGWPTRFFNDGPNSLLWAKSNGSTPPAQKYLDRSMGDQAVISTFEKNATLGTDGSGDEAALLSITRFLSADKQTGWNSGFLRPDSLFSAVIVSDEDESRTTCDVDPSLPNSNCAAGQTTHPAGDAYVWDDPAAKAQRVANFKAAFNAQRPNRPSLLRLDAVIVKTTTDGSRYDQSCIDSGEQDGSQGKTYTEVVNSYGGTETSICGDFAPDIEHLGNLISNSIERQFALKQDSVDPTTVVVKANGAALTANQFSYDAASNRVSLSDSYVSSLNLLAGSLDIKIEYRKTVIGAH